MHPCRCCGHQAYCIARWPIASLSTYVPWRNVSGAGDTAELGDADAGGSGSPSRGGRQSTGRTEKAGGVRAAGIAVVDAGEDSEAVMPLKR